MSKSGSRYGRRSNWFKIHCLLQEQQQQAANAVQNGCPKPPALSPNSLNLMRHPSYSTSIFSRPPCTKEEMMMLRLDEYAKQHQQQHPASSPSISSPDSHNSDSSIEIGDKRNSLLSKQSNNNKQHVPNTQSQLHHQPQQQPSPLALNKDLFLPLPFAGFPLMPPPGFLPPPTHFLFSSYHNALYEQNHHLLQQQVQQGLLKTATDLPTNTMISQKSPSTERDLENNSNGSSETLQIRENNNNHNSNNKKRHYTETLLDMQRKHISSLSSSNSLITTMTTKIPKRSNSPSSALHLLNSHHLSNRICKSEDDDNDDDEEEDIDMNNESDEVLTPPRSPKTPMITIENNPIDLSMKSGSSTKSDDINHNYYKTKTNNNKSPSDNFTMNGNSDSDSNDHHIANSNNKNNNNNNNGNRKTIHCHALKDGVKHTKQMNGRRCEDSDEDDDDNFRHHNNNNNNQYDVELKRRKLHLAAPLDLTTKV